MTEGVTAPSRDYIEHRNVASCCSHVDVSDAGAAAVLSGAGAGSSGATAGGTVVTGAGSVGTGWAC